MKRWRLFAIISLMLFCALLYAQSIPTSVPLNPETAKESTSDEVLPKAEMESPSQPQTNNAVSQGISRQPAEEKPYYLESYL